MFSVGLDKCMTSIHHYDTVQSIFVELFFFSFFFNPIMPCLYAKSLQLCLTLQPYGLYPPGSSVHGISQARILERVTIFSSRGSSQPRDGTSISDVAYPGRQAGSVPLAPPGRPPSCREFLGNGFQWLRLLCMGLTKPASLVGAGWHFH